MKIKNREQLFFGHLKNLIDRINSWHFEFREGDLKQFIKVFNGGWKTSRRMKCNRQHNQISLHRQEKHKLTPPSWHPPTLLVFIFMLGGFLGLGKIAILI